MIINLYPIRANMVLDEENARLRSELQATETRLDDTLRDLGFKEGALREAQRLLEECRAKLGAECPSRIDLCLRLFEEALAHRAPRSAA